MPDQISVARRVPTDGDAVAEHWDVTGLTRVVS